MRWNLRSKSSYFHGQEPDEFGFQVSKHDFQSVDENNANSADEVIGKMGLVLAVILGIVVAINLALNSLHL